MNVWYRVLIGVVAVMIAVVGFRLLIGSSTVASLTPAGPIAGAERHLIITMVLLMLIIVVPMFIALYTVAWKYRAGNPNRNDASDAKYATRSHGVWAELILWAIPAVLIAVLWVFTWQSAHALDPFNAIEAPPGTQPLTVEVVALEWKWLFIYPQQNIATVNWLEFPVGTPVHFELTADAPMSSFWIPQLGSQIYAMAAMETQLNLLASTTGVFSGRDTEINGVGYSGMTFTADSVSPGNFAAWVAQVQMMASSTASGTPMLSGASGPLDTDAYAALASPSEYNPPAYYSSVDPNLFENIMMKYMEPETASSMAPHNNATETVPSMPGMEM